MSSKVILSIFLLFLVAISNANAQENISYAEKFELYENFYSAIQMDSFIEIKQFIDFGVDINYRYEGNKTPLMFASIMGKSRSLRTLLELGADTDIKSADGKTALDYAKDTGNKFNIAMLNANPGGNHSLIKEIQYYLNKLGYNSGPTDGILGKRTSNALKQFAKNKRGQNPAEISYKQLEIIKAAYFGS